MAKVISVHGTFERGPSDGSRWWQKGSNFESDVLRYVEAENGQIEFEPLEWDSPNSEAARRAGGNALLERVRKIKADGDVCAIVGHSHGGSVIENAMVSASSQNARAAWSCVSGVVCVATPFIVGRAQGLPYRRLSFGKKIVFMAFLSWTLVQCFLAGMFRFAPEEDKARLLQFFGGWLPLILVTIATTIGPFVVYYIWVSYRWGARSTVFRRKSSIGKPLGDRTRDLFLCHRLDEAVSGLSSIEPQGPKLFHPTFAVTFINSAALVLLPLAIVIGLHILGSHIDIFNGAPVDHSVPFNSLIVGAMTISDRLDPIVRSFVGGLSLNVVVYGGGIIVLLVHMATYLLFAFVFVTVVSAVSWLISWLASMSLNTSVWRQLRSSAFGSDIAGEIATHARAVPYWVGDAERSGLPVGLENELTDLANASAAQAIPKIREALGKLVFTLAQPNWSAEVAKHLNWGELIHTTYFRSPMFRKLVCCAIADLPGFRASERLRTDPDYTTLMRWLAEIKHVERARRWGARAGPDLTASPGAATARDAVS